MLPLVGFPATLWSSRSDGGVGAAVYSVSASPLTMDESGVVVPFVDGSPGMMQGGQLGGLDSNGRKQSQYTKLFIEFGLRSRSVIMSSTLAPSPNCLSPNGSLCSLQYSNSATVHEWSRYQPIIYYGALYSMIWFPCMTHSYLDIWHAQ